MSQDIKPQTPPAGFPKPKPTDPKPEGDKGGK
jgi:hypothetical protein